MINLLNLTHTTLKFEGGERDPLTGSRKTRYVTVRGAKKDAQRELTRLLGQVENATAVEPSRITVGGYLKEWLDADKVLSPKTLAGGTTDRPALWRRAASEALPGSSARLARNPTPIGRRRGAAAVGAHGGPRASGASPRP